MWTAAREQPRTATVTLLPPCFFPASQESAFCTSGKNAKSHCASSGCLSVLLCSKPPRPDNKGSFPAVIWLKPLQPTITPPRQNKTFSGGKVVRYQKTCLPTLYSQSAVSGTRVLPPPPSLLQVYQMQHSGKTCPAPLPRPSFLHTRWGQQPPNVQVMFTFPWPWVGRMRAGWACTLLHARRSEAPLGGSPLLKRSEEQPRALDLYSLGHLIANSLSGSFFGPSEWNRR